jgi:hypothetical protein
MNDTLDLEKFWNEKHPQQKVLYSGRALPHQHYVIEGIQIDVRNMITVPDAILLQVIQDNDLKADSVDETMLRVQKWVVKNIKYVSDDENEGASEFWQFPFETLAIGIGDCEDGALLIASLAINAGIPSFRVRVNAGIVKEAPTAPEGGHGYCTYLAEDGDWRVIDWCYFEDSEVVIKDKPIFKNNQYYKDIWFSFNHIHSFGNKEYELSGRLKK